MVQPFPVLAILLVAALAARAGATPLGLGEALRRLEERGPEAVAAQAVVPIARADVRTARMFPNPTLAFSGGLSEPVFAGLVALHLPIFGQLGARTRAAERGVVQAQAEARFALWRLRHDGRVAYYAAVRAEEEVGIALGVERLTGQVADMARERFEVGTGTQLEKEQAALLHARALQDVSDRQAAARVARLELARLLGAEAEHLEPLADPLAQVGPTPALAQLVDGARVHHPELKQLEAERFAALARAQAGRAERRPIPTLELGAEVLSATTCDPKTHDLYGYCVGPRAGLSFDLPVLNLNGGPIQRAEAEARSAELRSVAAGVRVESAVRSAFEQWSAATVRARFFDGEYLPSANLVERMAREGFAAGKTGLLPLIEAERSVLEARLGRTEALFAVQQSRADLEEASGVTLSAP